MNDKFYINDLSEIRAFCIHSDKEDIYKYIYSLQQENARLKDKIKTVFEYVDSLTPAGYNSGDIYSDVQDELLELLKEN